MDLKELQKNDPLKRMVERQTEQPELSPMEPPEAYEPPVDDSIPYEDYHPLLQAFFDEHEAAKAELTKFEDILKRMREEGPQAGADGLAAFYRFLDEKILVHNQKEEKVLFPMLQEKMIADGDHSNGPSKTTAIDMLEDDHIKLMQLAAVSFNMIGLSSRLPDEQSAVITLDAGIEQGSALVEMLRLHVFREENVVFPMAQKKLTKEELDQLKVAFDSYEER